MVRLDDPKQGLGTSGGLPHFACWSEPEFDMGHCYRGAKLARFREFPAKYFRPKRFAESCRVFRASRSNRSRQARKVRQTLTKRQTTAIPSLALRALSMKAAVSARGSRTPNTARPRIWFSKATR